MRLSVVKLIVSACLMLSANFASALTLNSVDLSVDLFGGNLSATPAGPFNNVAPGAGNEFHVCISGPATTCIGDGLVIDIDITETSVTLGITGSTGTGVGGSTFSLNFSNFAYTPPSDLVSNSIALGSVLLDFGLISANNDSGMIQLTGQDNGDDQIAYAGAPIVFTFDTQPRQVPAPGSALLLALGLAGLGYGRRRSER